MKKESKNMSIRYNRLDLVKNDKRVDRKLEEMVEDAFLRHTQSSEMIIMDDEVTPNNKHGEKFIEQAMQDSQKKRNSNERAQYDAIVLSEIRTMNRKLDNLQEDFDESSERLLEIINYFYEQNDYICDRIDFLCKKVKKIWNTLDDVQHKLYDLMMKISGDIKKGTVGIRKSLKKMKKRT